MGSASPKLTPRQARFVEEYLVDLNATQSAIRAGYSARTAKAIASRLLTYVNVAAAVTAGREKATARTGLNRERILREVEIMAHSCVTDYVIDDNGKVDLAEGAHPDAMRAIKSIKRKRREWSDGSGEGHTVETEVELTFWDKPGMVKLAGRHKAIEGFSDREVPQSEVPDTEIEIYTGMPPDEDKMPAGSGSA